jgi:hypothetical protein
MQSESAVFSFGIGMQSMCIVVHLLVLWATLEALSRDIVSPLTETVSTGWNSAQDSVAGSDFWFGKCSFFCTKEAATHRMTFTVFSRHQFPKFRSVWRNGYLHRLS